MRLTHDFFKADDRHQRGVLHQDHEQVTQAGQGNTPHLRQHQLGENPRFGQAQCHARFAVALGNGQDGTAEHFGGIGTKAQAQREYTRRKGAEGEVGHADVFADGAHQVHAAKVDQQHPEQFGHAANQGRIGAAQPSKRFEGGCFGQGTEQSEHQAQTQRSECQFDGHQRASGKRRAESV